MVDNPISNSGVSPTQPTPPYGPDHPRLGAGEEAQEPKPFSLPPEGSQTIPGQVQSGYPSPMEAATEAARQQPQLAPDQVSNQISQLQDKLGTIQSKLQDSSLSQNLTPDHFQAMQQVAQKMNPDMQNIAKYSNGEFSPPEAKKGQNPLEYITNWIGGAQNTLGGALNYLQNTDKPDIGSFFKLQYSVQRASQKGELFASIVGSSVSGIKTLMSTQLG